MSTLDLLPPDDHELMELLAGVFLEEKLPPASGFVSLLIALDDQFGDPEPQEHAEDRPSVTTVPEAARPDPTGVIPLRCRVLLLVSTVAAALVLLAVGLAWSEWPRQHASPPGLTKLQYAASSLQRDLGAPNTSARTARDVTTLADALAQVPSAQHASVGSRPGQLLAEACDRLVEETRAGGSVPDACSAISQLRSTPQGNGQSAGTGQHGSGGPAATSASGDTGFRPSVPWYLTTSGTGSPRSVAIAGKGGAGDSPPPATADRPDGDGGFDSSSSTAATGPTPGQAASPGSPTGHSSGSAQDPQSGDNDDSNTALAGTAPQRVGPSGDDPSREGPQRGQR